MTKVPSTISRVSQATADPVTYYFTPAGSTAQILFEQSFSAQLEATLSQVYIVDSVTSTVAFRLTPDRAPQTTSAKLSIYHGATNFDFFDVYLVDRGTELTDQVLPILFSISSRSLSPVVELPAGSYDLYVTNFATRDPIAPALPIDLALGDVVELIAVDTVDPAVIDVVDITLP